MPGFDLDDLNFTSREYNYQLAYCQSKRANVLHAVALTKRLAGTGITANSVHPGAIRTEVFRDLTEEHVQGAFAWSAASGSPEKSPTQGAATEIWAAVSPDGWPVSAASIWRTATSPSIFPPAIAAPPG